MKKLTSLLAAALTLAACGPKEDPATAYRDALPKAEAVQIGTPQSTGGSTAAALSVHRDALGDSTAAQSEYAIQSYYLALTINTGVGWTLGLVHFITRFPPTTCDAHSCTWGPWVDDNGLNRWKLNVVKAGDGVYDWALSGQPGSAPAAPFVDFISGTAHPSDKDHGTGTLDVDFEAEATLDHGPLWQQTDFGQLHVSYDTIHDPSISAQFLNAKNDDPQKPHFMNAAYSFQAGSSGGELQVAFEDLDTGETASLRTRWAPSGAGRSDAHYVGTGELWASECWAGAAQDFVEVYDSKYPDIGPETACSPFNSAEYADVVLP